MSDQPEAQQPTVKERLTAHMVGYPFSLIPWPHRVLRDAVAEIEALKAERDALRDALECVLIFEPEHCGCGEPICNEPQQAWQKARAALDAARNEP